MNCGECRRRMEGDVGIGSFASQRRETVGRRDYLRGGSADSFMRE